MTDDAIKVQQPQDSDAQNEISLYPTPVRPLTLDNLIEYINQSSYLFDPSNPLFSLSRVRLARWHEIGAFFGVTGETAVRHWLKAVARYKYVLRKLLLAKLCNKPIRPPGPWFDKVGTIIGATYDEAMEVLDPAQGLEDCLHHILLRTRNIIPEEKLSTIPSGDDDCSIESKRMKRDVGDYDEPELD